MRISTLLLAVTLALGGLAYAATTALPAFTPPPAPAAEDASASDADDVIEVTLIGNQEAPGGKFTKGLWTKTVDNRTFSISANYDEDSYPNNFNSSTTTGLQMHGGLRKCNETPANGYCRYEISMTGDNGYIVSAFSFDMVNASGDAVERAVYVDNESAKVVSPGHFEYTVPVDAEKIFFILKDTGNKGIIISNLTVTLTKKTIEGTPVSFAGDICTLYKDSETTGESWNNLWRRNEAPLASMSNGRNNIAATTTGTNGVIIATGQSAMRTEYIFDSGDDKKYIAGYTFKARRAVDAERIDIVAAGNTYSPADATTPVEVIVTGLAEPTESNTASFVLTSATANLKAEIYDVVLYLKDRATPVKTPNYVFPSTSSRKYRIPAIATVGAGEHEGRLVAIGDYRYGHGLDIGGRIIDLNFAVSDDNGATWTAPALFKDGEDNILSQGQAGATFEMAYGDAAVTADRESHKILVMACAGNIGYFGGAPGNYGAKFVSDDAGDTWTKTNVTDQIKNLFADSNYGKLLSYFFGSGRLMQSRYVKVGEYYRVYGAISGRDNAGTSRNWILYTDDFGDTWHVLGDVNTPPVPSGGDEPKCEELPDGSVLLSARRGGGRNFNIFRYTDPATGKGEWDGLVASSLNANTSGFNACDGEVMILPVRPAANAEGSAATAYIALQSYPDSKSRDHITISWKLLETADDFKSTQAFVSDWDGRYLVYEGDAWYSTWSLDSNHDLAFLFERVVPGGAASLEHRAISISTVTDGAWVYADDNDSAVENELTRQMLTARVKAAGLEEVLTADVIAPACTPSQSWQVNASLAELAPAAALLSLNPEGPATRVGEYSKSAVDAFKADFNSIIADTEKTLIEKTEAIKTLAAEVKPAEIVSGADYRVQNYGGNHQLLSFGTDALGFVAAADKTPDEAVITFKANGDNWELWQGTRTVTSELAVGEPAEGTSPVTFRIDGPATTFAGAFSISNTAKASQAAIHINNNSRLIYWNAVDGNNGPSFWYLTPVFEPAIEGADEGLTVTRGSSITVRLVKDPVPGCSRYVASRTDGMDASASGIENGRNYWTFTVPEDFEGTEFILVPSVEIGGISIEGAETTVTVTEAAPSVEPQSPEEAEGVGYTAPAEEDDPATEDIDETAGHLKIDLAATAIEYVDIPSTVKNTDAPADHFEFRYDGDDIAAAEFVSEGEEGAKTHKIRITHKGTDGTALIALHRKAAQPVSRAAEEEDAPVWKLYVTVTGAKPATEGIATSISLTGYIPSQLYLTQSFTVGATVEPAESTDDVEWTFTANPADAVKVVDNGDGTYTVTALSEGTLTVTARLATHAADAAVTEVTRTVTLRNATGNPGEGVTGIEAVNADAAQGRAVIHDLAGRRLNRIEAAGIYIVNGRKTLVR